jgi:putative transposase
MQEPILEQAPDSCMMSANDRRVATRKATKQHHKQMECRVFELKIQKASLNKTSQEMLKRMFLEAKWLYNHSLDDGAFDASSNPSEVRVKVKDDYQTRPLTALGVHMKQDVVDGLRQNIRNLAKAKEKGIKVGALNFVSHYDSINLKEYGNTYAIKGNRIRIQKIKQWVRVLGARQLEGHELANAKLIHRAGDYFIHVTAYRQKENKPTPTQVVGVDLGLEHQIAMSDGRDGLLVDYVFPFPKRLRKLYSQLSRKQKHSANWHKQLTKIRKEFGRWSNRKKDTRNKICSALSDFRVAYQDDSMRGWQRIWGRKMLSTGIGGITARLKKSVTSIQVDRFYPSTQTCPKCGSRKKLVLSERTYSCGCGFVAQRDIKSAMAIRAVGSKEIGLDGPEYTPVEMKPLLAVAERLNHVPRLRASFVAEAGSPLALAVGGRP